VDVAAMSTDGGALLYGIAEDEHGRPTISQPISLAGAADRLGQIIATSISEVPYTDMREFPTDDDLSRGYLLVLVPQSARAPHQVIVGGDLRFYGRGAKGNRILGEAEVARLYQRRQEWEQDRDKLLAEAISQAPYPPQSTLAYLHGFVRPVAPDRGIWERAVAKLDGDRQALLRAMDEAATGVTTNENYDPNLKSGKRWNRQGADEWRVTSNYADDERDANNARYTVRVRANIDGRGHLFCGRAGEVLNPRANAPDEHGKLLMFEAMIAGNVAGFLAMMGTLYSLAGYVGHVDVGIAVTGLRGGIGYKRQGMFGFYDESAAYNADAFPRHARYSAAELDQPEQVAWDLLRHLMEALSGREDYSPFT
jgi:hypothetical protein